NDCEYQVRDAEAEGLRSLAGTEQAMIVTGGGIVLREENVDLLKRFGTLVLLDANEQTLFERASRVGTRPLLEGKNPRVTFARMLRARLPLYARVAHLRVDTSALTDEEVAVAILSKLARLNPEPRSPIPATAL